MSPDARQWWQEQFQLSKYKGSTTNLYIWTDMNKPSVFNGPEVSWATEQLCTSLSPMR